MPVLGNLLSKPRSRITAVILALLGTVTPIAGLHKFYLGQPLWGSLYILLLFSVPEITHIACAIEAVWYLLQDREQFNLRFNSPGNDETSPSSLLSGITESNPVGAIGDRVEEISSALRRLDQLRLDGLMSEYEFEQKRRQLLDRIN